MWLLLFHTLSFYQCLEKPIDEPFAILLCKSAMIVQVFLQVSECSLYLVVSIGHSSTVLPLPGKEIRQVEIKAVHG